MTRETSLGGPRRAFAPTAWTCVLQARGKSRAALDELIRAYWKPVYFYARRWGADLEDAKDLTQGFFADFVARDFLKEVSKEKGRFRTFVLTALEHYLINQAERSRAKKRGGGRPPISLDFGAAETDYTPTQASKEPLDRYFQRQWALTVLERALDALSKELPADRFEAVRSHLSPGEEPSYEETAQKLAMTLPNVKNLLHRARKRYRELIRDEVRAGVESDEVVDQEIRDLFAAL